VSRASPSESGRWLLVSHLSRNQSGRRWRLDIQSARQVRSIQITQNHIESCRFHWALAGIECSSPDVLSAQATFETFVLQNLSRKGRVRIAIRHINNEQARHAVRQWLTFKLVIHLPLQLCLGQIKLCFGRWYHQVTLAHPSEASPRL